MWTNFILHLYMISTFMMIMGTMVVVSSSCWVVSWLGMELNMLGFISVLNNKDMKVYSEVKVKYFLVQAISSSVFLMSSMYNVGGNNFPLVSFYMMLTLLIKSGIVPFHYWVISVSEFMGWYELMLLLTWQKIAPLILLCFSSVDIVLLILVNSVVGGVSSLNQNNLKKLSGFSSIMHMSWMLAVKLMKFSLMMMYLFFYSISSILVCVMFLKLKVFFFGQLCYVSKIYMMMVSLGIFSLLGFPPLIMFFSKIFVIMQVISGNSYFSMILFLSLMVLIGMYSYIRMVLPMLLGPVKMKLSYMIGIVDNFWMILMILGFLFLLMFCYV